MNPWTEHFTVVLLAVGDVLLAAAFLFIFKRSRRIRQARDRLMREKEVILGFVHDISEVFSDVDTIDLNRVLERVLYFAMRTSRAGAGAIYMLDANSGMLSARALAGIVPPLNGHLKEEDMEQSSSKSQRLERLVRTQTIKRGDGLIGEVADFGAPRLIPDAERDPRVPQYQTDFLKIHSLLAMPLIFQRTLLGVLVVLNPVDGTPFNHEHLNLLQSLSDQASVSIHYLGLSEALDAKRRMDHDLSVARHIQANLLPRHIPEVAGYELAAFNLPAMQIGGDYYDMLELDDRHLGIAVADVSGKGVSGAILMSSCRSILRVQARQSLEPAEVLRQLNRVMSPDVSEDMFVSILYMVLDTQTGCLRLARAGHEKPLWFRGGGREAEWLDSPGIAIGLADDIAFDAVLKEITIDLEPDDFLFAYTDGITEAMNAGSDEWGAENFLETVEYAPRDRAETALNAVKQQVLKFMGNRQQYDDMTLVALHALPEINAKGPS